MKLSYCIVIALYLTTNCSGSSTSTYKKRSRLSHAAKFDLEMEQEVKLLANERLRSLGTQRAVGQQIDKFLADGADINGFDGPTGKTALHCAAESGDFTLVKHLIRRGAHINVTDRGGRTPLHWAAISGDSDVVLYLMRNDPSLQEKQNFKSERALHCAAEKGNLEACMALVNAGCAVDPVTSAGRTPLHLAARWGHTDVVAYLLSKGASLIRITIGGNTALHEAAIGGHVDTAITLIERGINKEAQAEDRITALLMAVKHGHKEFTRVLLERKCQVNARLSNEDCALHLAVRLGAQDLCELLIQYGAGLDVRNKDGVTPLHLAVQEGLDLLAVRLAELGADTLLKTPQGETSNSLALNRKPSSSNAVLAVALFTARKAYLEQQTVSRTSTEIVQTSVAQTDTKYPA